MGLEGWELGAEEGKEEDTDKSRDQVSVFITAPPALESVKIGLLNCSCGLLVRV